MSISEEEEYALQQWREKLKSFLEKHTPSRNNCSKCNTSSTVDDCYKPE